nr:MAG TPA: EVH1 domain protein [Caudoviricetes sp.]
MAKRPQPAPGAVYECDRLDDPMFLAIRLYANRLELDRGTTYLHRYKKTEAYKVTDLQGVTIKKRTVTWRYSALRSLPLKFKKAEDAQEFYNAVNSL